VVWLQRRREDDEWLAKTAATARPLLRFHPSVENLIGV
jgi:hypothetical protein